MNVAQKTLGTLLGMGLVALLSNSVLADEQAASKRGCGHSWSKEQESKCGMSFDKWMAALHTALKLSAAQEATWTEFSNKMKPVEMDKPMRQDWKGLSTPDRLDRMLDNMKSREKSMAERAAAVRVFYDTLNPDQKNTFDKHFQKHHQRHDRRSSGKK